MILRWMRLCRCAWCGKSVMKWDKTSALPDLTAAAWQAKNIYAFWPRGRIIHASCLPAARKAAQSLSQAAERAG